MQFQARDLIQFGKLLIHIMRQIKNGLNYALHAWPGMIMFHCIIPQVSQL